MDPEDLLFPGTPGPDHHQGAAGDDTLHGAGGADRLFGGMGDDRLFGGSGNDTLGADGRSADQVEADGGTGRDVLELYDHFGRDALDFIATAQGFTRITAQGHQTLIRNVEQVQWVGLNDDGGRDYVNRLDLVASVGAMQQAGSLLAGTLGDDVFIIPALPQTGPARWGEVYGNDGNDRIELPDDFDYFTYGGAGNDTVLGGLRGENLLGGSGADRLYGRDGIDTLEGEAGHDRLFGGSGADSLRGATGRDRLFGGNGADDLVGGQGRDRLSGGNGNDRLLGQAGTDWISGGAGDDRLFGGADDDTLGGNAGNDTVSGGDGYDSFVFETGSGSDVFADFGVETDVLQLTRSLWSDPDLTVAQVVARFARVEADGVMLRFDGGETLLLQGLTALDGLADALYLA